MKTTSATVIAELQARKAIKAVLNREKTDFFPYMLMAPGLLLVGFVTIYPLFFAIDFSLSKTQVFQQLGYIGFENYLTLISDPRFRANFLNSTLFVFGSVALTWCFGLSLALFLRRQSWGTAVLRTIILIPWVTNQVVLALMWKWLLNGEMSPINDFLYFLGLPAFNPLIDVNLALPTLTFINAWRAMGFALLLMLAGLAAIPLELEEAAEIDGATYFQKIRFIIIPLLKPISLSCIITLTISFFNIVVLPLDLTGGGPLNATEVISLRLYREGFQYYNIAMASTITVVLVSLDLILSYVYFRMIRSEADSK